MTRSVGLFESGRFDESINDANLVLMRDMNNIDALCSRALSLSASSRLDQAIQDFTAAIRLMPDTDKRNQLEQLLECAQLKMRMEEAMDETGAIESAVHEHLEVVGEGTLNVEDVVMEDAVSEEEEEEEEGEDEEELEEEEEATSEEEEEEGHDDEREIGHEIVAEEDEEEEDVLGARRGHAQIEYTKVEEEEDEDEDEDDEEEETTDEEEVCMR